MKRRPRLLRNAAIAATAIAVGIQFVPVDRTNPTVISDITAPTDVDAILRRACYDCHSHETRWPWYSTIAPASWFVVRHVERGRGDLNFSEWPALDFELQDHAFTDIEEQLVKGEMPLKSYTLLHPDARLSELDRNTLLRWARSHDVDND